MLPYHLVDHFLQYAPTESRELILEIRNLVFAAVPDAQEEMRGRNLVYFRSAAGGPVISGVCGISRKGNTVRVYFTHGAFIPGPHHLLRGTGKAMRALELRDYAEVPWEALQELILAHANLDPKTLPQNRNAE